MIEKIGCVIRSAAGVVEKADDLVLRWSKNRAEDERQKRFAVFMKKIAKEFAGKDEELGLLVAYAQTKAEYRRLLLLRGQRSHVFGSLGLWADHGGNQVEARFFRLVEEIRARYPDLTNITERIDDFLPFR